MSEISNEIDRIISDVNTAHEAVLAKGGTTAQPYTARSLASAINTIPISSGGGAPIKHADTHSFSDTLTWDGDTTGRVVHDIYGDGSELYYRISDVVPTIDDLANGFGVKVWDNTKGEELSLYAFLSKEEGDGGVDVYPNGGIFEIGIAIVPTDNYCFEWYDVTFPQKGVYFMKFIWDGYDQITTSLTIPGFIWHEGSDPITPEMISAAPSYHSDASAVYGPGSDDEYGHVKLATYGKTFTPGEDVAIILPDEMADDAMGALKDYAVGAYFFYAFVNVSSYMLEAIDNELIYLSDAIRELQGK